MYTNENLDIVQDNAPYRDSNGTNYPRNYPKDEIAELFPVQETPKDTDPNVVIEGFHIEKIESNYVQVWNVRSKTEEELQDDTLRLEEALKSQAQQALTTSDMVALRCIKANVAFPADWQAYVADLRLVIQGASSVLPVQPDYPVES
jgi:hypothetical protein